MDGAQIRFDNYKGKEFDDTALNGLKIRCNF